MLSYLTLFLHYLVMPSHSDEFYYKYSGLTLADIFAVYGKHLPLPHTLASGVNYPLGANLKLNREKKLKFCNA